MLPWLCSAQTSHAPSRFSIMTKRVADDEALRLPSDTQICSQCGEAMETRSWHNWINMGKGPIEEVLNQWHNKSGVWISHDCLYHGTGGLFVPSCYSCMEMISATLTSSLKEDSAPIEDTIMQSLLREQISCKMALLRTTLGQVPVGRFAGGQASSSSKRNKIDFSHQ